ncbi:Transducin/WD40 repeat-like superfamily protein [Klebsormidium nitens]|uniref:Transducin/WD40 repeat-like superfamily protein n=1 Tax=Klebsormidium nitens TaxID=105231 RepID=A0A1Y1IH18_KLENI|nr:Transducin/WD40 repeat-like superfamily protein [Klebsormidium nitens]|eukprot:GAQ87438.1 Transducin/WD40 repeat-like superfamily protein [Klebsormidium nitens]
MELTSEVVSSMAIGAVFKDFDGKKINSLDFHRTEDRLVTASDDEAIRLYDTANAKWLKTIHSKKYGVDKIVFTHHRDSVLYSSKNGWDESLRYLSLHNNSYLRYFKGHRDRVVSLCMSPKNDMFMSGSLDHTVRLWDLRSNACQGLMRVRGRPAVAYDEQGLVFAVSMEGGAIKLFDVRSYDKGPFDTFLVGGDTAEVTSMKFSNDGKHMLLSTANSWLYVLDAFEGHKLHTFELQPVEGGGTLEASFSPNGQFIVSGSGDGTIRVWSVESGTEVACWVGHAGVPAKVKWAPRRMLVASASEVLAFWIPDLNRIAGFGT